MLRACGGTFKLGIEFVGWGAPGRPVHARLRRRRPRRRSGPVPALLAARAGPGLGRAARSVLAQRDGGAGAEDASRRAVTAPPCRRCPMPSISMPGATPRGFAASPRRAASSAPRGGSSRSSARGRRLRRCASSRGETRRRRPVHRLHRFPRAADCRGARRRLRGMGTLAAVRPCRGAADREQAAHWSRTRRPSPCRRAGAGAFRSSTGWATATSTAAPSCADDAALDALLAAVDGAPLRRTEPAALRRRPAEGRVGRERHRRRARQRLSRAPRIDEHLPRPVGHRPAAQAAPRPRERRRPAPRV